MDSKHSVWLAIHSSGSVTQEQIREYGLLDVVEYHATALDEDTKCVLLKLADEVRESVVRRFLRGMDATCVMGYAKNASGMLSLYQHTAYTTLCDHKRGKNPSYSSWSKNRWLSFLNFDADAERATVCEDFDFEDVRGWIDDASVTVNRKLDRILAAVRSEDDDMVTSLSKENAALKASLTEKSWYDKVRYTNFGFPATRNGVELTNGEYLKMAVEAVEARIGMGLARNSGNHAVGCCGCCV
jgi:hypothetical protein